MDHQILERLELLEKHCFGFVNKTTVAILKVGDKKGEILAGTPVRKDPDDGKVTLAEATDGIYISSGSLSYNVIFVLARDIFIEDNCEDMVVEIRPKFNAI